MFFIFLPILNITADMIDRDDYKVYIWLDKYRFFRDDPVYLKMVIKNISGSHVSFDIFETRNSNRPEYSTFQPVVFDMDGKEAEIIIPYRLEQKKVEDVAKKLDKRNIRLGPNDEFVQTINLSKVYNLLPEKKYRVKGFFYPDFSQKTSVSGEAALMFSVTGESREPERYYAKDIRHEISANEVILLALDAEKSRNWNKMLKYIDVEKYISVFPEFVRTYNFANIIERKNIINRFIMYLSRERDDYILDFKVIKDEFDSESKLAYVHAFVERFSPVKSEKYEYRYTLEKFQNLWLIVGLQATIIKGLE